LTELTAFQRDLLVEVNRQERGIPVEIKTSLEEHYSDGISDGRLYPNLDKLVEDGLADRSERDGRSDYYYLTAAGREALLRDLGWRESGAGFYQPSLDDLDALEDHVPADLEAALDRVVDAGLAVPICRGEKKDGSRCGRRVKAGGYCHLHQDQADEEADQ
jgi:DNA-binding PadR family transcriptional regulator